MMEPFGIYDYVTFTSWNTKKISNAATVTDAPPRNMAS